MHLTHFEMLLRLAAAMVLGGMIGYERSLKDHPAGLRTHILVALASATFMLVSAHLVYFQNYDSHDPIRVDPSRIASGVVMGIGFIGGGSILRHGLDVHGLTTAASLWLVAAVGLAAGSGMYPEAVAATVASLFVLVGLSILEGRYKRKLDYRLVLVFDAAGDRTELIGRVREHVLDLAEVEHDCDVHRRRSRLLLEVGLAGGEKIEPLMAHLEGLPGLRLVRCMRKG